MIHYFYTFKGGRDSLLALHTTVTFCVCGEVRKDMEFLVPKSKATLYGNPSRFCTRIIDLATIPVWYTEPQKVNLGINQQAQVFSRLIKKPSNGSYYVRYVVKPTNWASRLAIMSAVYYRNERLLLWSDRISDFKYQDYYRLEKNKQLHKEYLRTLEILPEIYDWVKVMNLFKDDPVKPLWYDRELLEYKKQIGEI